MPRLTDIVRLPHLRAAACSAALLLAAGPSGAWAQDHTTDPDQVAVFQDVAALVRAQMDDHDIKGLSLALVNREGVLWAAGFGFADVAERRAATAATIYPASTISMTLTAAAVMQLVERGQVQLDQPLTRYLPEFSIRTRFADTPPITVRRLLSHHAGLPAMHFRGMMGEQPESLREFVARLRGEYLIAPPDAVHAVSYPGYSVIGRMLETLGRQSFPEHMRSALLDRLRMHDSTFLPGPDHRARLATTYRRGKEIAHSQLRDLPAIGLHATVLDIARFAQMLLNDGRVGPDAVLLPASIHELFRPQNRHVALDVNHHVGLGWRLSGIRPAGIQRIVWQDAASPYSGGRLIIAPGEKLALIILANSNKVSDAADAISQSLFARLTGPRLGPTPASSVTHDDTTLTAAVSARPELRGHYATPLGLVSVGGRAGVLHAEVFGKTLELIEHPAGGLGMQYRLLGLLRLPIDPLTQARLWPTEVEGRPSVLLQYKGQLVRFAERLPATIPLPPVWRQRLGTYEVLERDAILDLIEARRVTFKYDDGIPYFDFRLPGWLGLRSRTPVIPVSDTELVIAGTGWMMGDTIHVVHVNGEERLRYSGYHFRLAKP